ncbi:MAG TPA: chemotaxis protein CheA [Vicinamibacteria bacterium]|nr:chemotaxis protein CheA [Vicinamibacteria bacterium]
MSSTHADLLQRLRVLAGAARPEVPAGEPRPLASAPGATNPTAAREALAARTRTLRVEVETLDRLLDLTGEIAVARGRVRQLLGTGADEARRAVLEVEREADRLHAELQELVMQVRMVPVSPLFARYARTVRDAAAAEGKRARLVVGSDDVEVDTKVVEAIRDPLTHLVRNAVAHGIERPEDRERSGKEPGGTVWLEAVRDTSSIVIRIADDGAGLDRARILDAARRRGLVADGSESLDDAQIHQLIFEPGFSTSAAVTGLSGRGVGLDVVRRNVESVRGSVSVAPREGGGTVFTIRLPLTLAIIQGFGLAVGAETLVVPLEAVLECLDLTPDSEPERKSGVLNLRGEALPFLRLRQALRIPGAAPEREQVLVVHQQGRRVGLVADRLLGESQNVIKPLGRLFRNLPGVAASTILGDGRVALLLDVDAVIQEAAALAAA